MSPGAASRRCTAVLVLGLLLVAAGCGHTVSDTGVLGTWERELGPGRFSRIAIWEEDGQMLFCWSTRGSSPGERVRCAPGGISETIEGREVIYEHRFSVRPAAEDDIRVGREEIFVDVEGVPLREGQTPIRWTDRLTVRPGGLELWSYKVSLNGEETKNVRRHLSFTKIADVPI